MPSYCLKCKYYKTLNPEECSKYCKKCKKCQELETCNKKQKSKFNFTKDWGYGCSGQLPKISKKDFFPKNNVIDYEKYLWRKLIVSYVFDDLDKIIEKCKKDKPIPYEISQFKKLYEELKEKWLE